MVTHDRLGTNSRLDGRRIARTRGLTTAGRHEETMQLTRRLAAPSYDRERWRCLQVTALERQHEGGGARGAVQPEEIVLEQAIPWKLAGWWSADPAAAVAIAALAAKEGVDTWRGESCDCCRQGEFSNGRRAKGPCSASACLK
jgi:hypothetical protein